MLAPPACTAQVSLSVVQLPDTPVVDMRRPLPPLPHARVEVAEIGRHAGADAAGTVHFSLPLSAPCDRGQTYTFVTTSPKSAYQAVLRRIFYSPGPHNLRIFFDPRADLYADESFKPPPKAPVTVILLDRRGVFPVADATVRIPALNLGGTTDAHGEVDLVVPLGGPWTFTVTRSGETAPAMTFRRAVPDDGGSTRFVVRLIPSGD